MLNYVLDRLWPLRKWLIKLRPPSWHREARRAGFFPAYADFVGYFALDAAGEVWFREDTEAWTEAVPVRELELRHVARVLAARWSREMKAYVPHPGPASGPCPSCHGSGSTVPARMRHVFLCECGGTGWVPAGWNYRSRRESWATWQALSARLRCDSRSNRLMTADKRAAGLTALPAAGSLV